jgi:glycosyltransferase involved in cell wall biosynthesis
VSAPAASICIPTLSARRLPYLREAVASALAQTLTNIEVLISDDGHDAAIEAFARDQIRSDHRVRYRRNERRLGLGGNWNAAAQDARGTYLILIGDDDRLLPHFVETLLAARGPDTAVLFCNHYVIDANGTRRDDLTRATALAYRRRGLPRGRLADAASCVWGNSVPMSASLTRTDDVKRLGIRPDLNTPEIELFARLAAERKEFVFVPDYLTEYRVHPQSETAAGFANGKLIKYMDPIDVPEHVKPLKRAFMSALTVSAVDQALRNGEMDEARRIMEHRYYPTLRRHPTKVVLHHLATALTPTLAKGAMNTADNARGYVRRTLLKLGGRPGTSSELI